MTEPTRQQIEDLFFEALELPASEREAFLDRRCGDDDAFRASVNELLAADAAAGGAEFLESAFLGAPESGSHKLETVGNESSPEDARFQVVAKHRKGGLGEVLIAYDRQLKRDVAIKQIKPKWRDHQEARQRFVQEAEVTGRLEHPGVVPVYAMGTWEDGRHYYAMRFIEGTTLKEAIQQFHDPDGERDEHSRQLELRHLLNDFVDVCNTIGYAHSRQILHRDIKPSNIMVGPYGETLVVDWGLAKLLDAPFNESLTMALADSSKESGSTPTRVGGTVGTPQYMSPEQASGRLKDIGIGTDIYLLGATLYQILTGKPPHSEESISKLLERISQGKLTPPHVLRPDVPPALEAICLKAMSAHASARYANCQDLADDVECWMADEPVSVYEDPLPDRLSRWLRRHRTAAYSGAVAAILLTLGSIVGSAFWSYSRAAQFRIEKENSAKEATLIAERQQRLVELRGSARLATQFANNETRANRFSSAVGFLQSAMDGIGEEPELAAEYDGMDQQAKRLQQIVDFYHYADYAQERNVLSRDTKAITACVSALQSLQIWDRDDWWFHLPDEDLTPPQQDQLRWDVYQQWLMLNSMLTKTIGTRLLGAERSGSISGFFKSIRRLRSTNAGKNEARAVMVISDRIDRFRLSEATRWYRGVAQFRLDEGPRVAGSELGISRNAADAQKLGVLCMIAALDRGFQLFFRGYQGDDPLEAARDLFNRSSTLRPDHYWTQLALAQVEYKLAERSAENSWRKYEPAVQATGRCIALNPEKCFAYADRSSMYRAQARAIRKDESFSLQEREHRANEFLQWSLADAELADHLGADEPWVGWQHGLALYEIGQSEEAIKRFLKASKLTYALISTEDSALVRVDDLRGRSEAREIAAKLLTEQPQIRLHALDASIALNQNRLDEAVEAAERAMAMPGISSHAYAVRGMARLKRKQFELAADDFRQAINVTSNHPWAVHGLAVCDEQAGRAREAYQGFVAAFAAAPTDDGRAAALLGQGRQLALAGRLAESTEVITKARQLSPGCDLNDLWRPLAVRYKAMRAKSPDANETEDLADYLRSIAELPSVSQIKFASNLGQSTSVEPRAALLNGGFELSSVYWSDPAGGTWLRSNDYRSDARVSDAVAHSGSRSLHILGGKSAGPDQNGRTGQTFPVEAGQQFQISFWCKADQITPGAISLRMLQEADGDALQSLAEPIEIVRVEQGTYDWREYSATFRSTQVEGKRTVQVRLEIVSAGAGKVWIDDVQVRQLQR